MLRGSILYFLIYLGRMFGMLERTLVWKYFNTNYLRSCILKSVVKKSYEGYNLTNQSVFISPIIKIGGTLGVTIEPTSNQHLNIFQIELSNKIKNGQNCLSKIYIIKQECNSISFYFKTWLTRLLSYSLIYLTLNKMECCLKINYNWIRLLNYFVFFYLMM